jgi:hypothetical protein
MKNSRIIRKLEADTRKLLAKAGKVSENIDSARLMDALGHIAQAAANLKDCGTVLEARERHEEEEQ